MSNCFRGGLERLDLVLSEPIINEELKFVEELLRWNKKINLTSIKLLSEAIEKHLLDSLVLLRHIGTATTMLDIGSGGGLPGIPLAIAKPDLHVVSVDSVGKKINFQKHIKRLQQLNNLTPLNIRIEDLLIGEDKQNTFDLVVSRAFSSIENFLACATPRVRVGGRLIAMKGPEGQCEVQSARSIIAAHGYGDPEIVNYSLPFSTAKRQLLIFKHK